MLAFTSLARFSSQGFSFPNPNFSVFLPGYLSVLPPTIDFFFVFELAQELLVHPHSPSGVLA